MVDTQAIPNKLTPEDILSKVKKVSYLILPDSTTTVCQLTLENGYTVIGTSACVDPKNFNQEIGERIAHSNAFQQIWSLEGYLLMQKRFEAGL